MSFLPQRKKSSEEIAKLRENLGIPPSPTSPATSGQADPSNNPAATPPPGGEMATTSDEPAAAAAARDVPVPMAADPRPGRTFKKSEPAMARPAGASGQGPASLPARRHSQQELEAFRRHEIATMLPPPANPKLSPAHPAVLAVGYLMALGGATPLVWPLTWPALPMAVPATCVGASLLVALFVFRCKPLSLHHAAFIAVIALFVLVFGALHYFPQLANAT